MFENDVVRLNLIDGYLHSKDYAALEQITVSEFDKGLLSEQTLDAARALRLTPTVIYLASLAQENLPDPLIYSQWLVVYQAIARGSATPDLMKLNPRSPLRGVACQVATGQSLSQPELTRYKADATAWKQALELAMDFARYDAVECLVSELVRRRTPVIEWLHITRTLFARHQGVSTGAATSALGRSYALIRQQIPTATLSQVTLRSRLALYASHCFIKGSDYAAAIEHAQHATTPEDRIMGAVDVAKAYCHAGDLSQSIAWLDKLIGMVVERQSALDHEEVNPAQKKPFDPVEAAHALVDLQTVLAAVGQRPFLVSGTLLGFAREGQLLAHDKDIDVGIIGWEDQFDVVNALLQSRKFAVDVRHLNGQGTYHIPLMHLSTQVNIDVFVYHREDGRLVTGVESTFGYLQKFAFTPFDLKTVRFLDIDFHVPSDVELNLAENFGEWRTPDPGYISHLESPSTTEVGGAVYQLVGRLRALEAIKANNMDKLSRVIRLMTDHQSMPHGMHQQVLDQLQGVLLHHREEVPA